MAYFSIFKTQLKIDSETHKMVDITRDHWRSSGPTVCSKTLNPVARTMFKWPLTVSKHGDFTTSPGCLCQGSDIITVEKKSFLIFLRKRVFQFVPIAFCSLSGNYSEDADFILHVFVNIDKISSQAFSSSGRTVLELSGFLHSRAALVP